MAEIQDKCKKCRAKVTTGYDFCLSCGTKFSELPPVTKIRHMKGHHKKRTDTDPKFWTKLEAKIFLGFSLAGAIIGGIIAMIISINIAGISLALLWAIPLGLMIGALAPLIFLILLEMVLDI
jgi:hypothetical protein